MGQVKVNFPAIHKGMTKVKDAPAGSPYNYVSVKHGVAIIVSTTLIICVDLKDYLVNYQTVEQDQRADFDSLLAWLENKSFTSDFWAYLTGWHFVEVLNETQIKITGDKFEKVLIWEENGSSVDQAIKMLCANIKMMKQAIPAFGVSRTTLKKIDDAVGKIIGPNSLIWELNATGPTVRFTVEKMGFIFGASILGLAMTGDQHLFQNYRNFVTACENTLFT